MKYQDLTHLTNQLNPNIINYIRVSFIFSSCFFFKKISEILDLFILMRTHRDRDGSICCVYTYFYL